MATLLEQLSYLNDTKNLIKEAIENKGVEVPNRTAFREYPSKIDEIQSTPPTFIANGIGSITTVIPRDRLDFPTMVGDQPLSTTFTYTGSAAPLVYGAKAVYIPDYFLAANLAPFFTFRETNTAIEELHCGSVNVTSWGNYPGYLSRLKVLDFPNLTYGIDRVQFLVNNPESTTLTINIPSATDVFHPLIGNSTHAVALTLNAPKLVNVSAYSSSSEWLQSCTGTWTFPAGTTLGHFKIPNFEQTMILPAITAQNQSASFNAGGSGMLHLYLGPNMTTCACAANFVTNAQYVDIHIPAGDSTTKATLDAAGVAYTQDYVI